MRNMEGEDVMVKQWARQKELVGNAVLMIRMGDFYEMFQDDAVVSNEVLGLCLTQGPGGIMLTGFPIESLDAYRDKLLAAGYVVSISENDDPKRLRITTHCNRGSSND